eukprot:TRINITY_DN10424_c0_g1_i1.p2 TRINITY_DN10424_c0_g1~~TRINITY_DN10424_c0_g1_i1.p2  ORF type:complete len:208 (-),score=53.49 TRINITY_DN10424_c0_g1_i1:67-690(-)
MTKLFLVLFSFAAVVLAQEVAVRVGHAVPGAPSVDIYANDNLFLADLRFGQLAAPRPVPAGVTLRLRLNLHNTNTTVTEFPASFTVSSLAFASGLPAKITPFVTPVASAPPAEGKAHIRFIHLSPDAPAVDISLKDGTKLFTNVAFQQAAAFLEVPAGSYDVVVTPTGSTTVVLSATLSLDNASYSVVAEGQVSDNTLEAILFREYQ